MTAISQASNKKYLHVKYVYRLCGSSPIEHGCKIFMPKFKKNKQFTWTSTYTDINNFTKYNIFLPTGPTLIGKGRWMGTKQ